MLYLWYMSLQVPVSSNEGRDSPEPTGMAAALEVALRQRRQHFSDHDKSKFIITYVFAKNTVMWAIQVMKP